MASNVLQQAAMNKVDSNHRHAFRAMRLIQKATDLIESFGEVDPDTAIANLDDAAHLLTEALQELATI